MIMIKKIIAVLTIFFYSTTYVIAAPTCVKTGSVCADATPCKTISGVSVCLANPAVNATCWKYTDTYKCIKPSAVDYCAALAATPGCSQVGSVCSATDTSFGTGCMTWTNTWQCGAGLATPANTVSLGTSYTIVANTLDNTACTTLASNPTCTLASHVCADTTPSKVINGLTVTLAQAGGCWSYTDSYSCLGTTTSTCASLVAKGCTLDTSKCIKYGLGSTCTLTENVYRCQSTPASSSTVTDCGGSRYCTGGKCFNTSHTPDTDMAQTTAMMEAMRQGGNYMDPATMRIFGGEGGSCTANVLNSCCKPSGGAGMNNSSAIGMVVQQGISVGGQAVSYGSKYMYDTLYSNSSMLRGADAMIGSVTGGSLYGGSATPFSPSFGVYGFTASFGAAPAGATVLGSAGGVTFAFDPTSLAIAVAIMVVTEIMSCTPDEKKLSMKLGQNLCRFTGSYCSMEIPIIGVCLETTQTYCCFNSRLARIMNTAGGAQIGRAATDCTGFTPDQFAALDFSKIDLSEFTAEIMASVKMPNMSAIGGDSTARMTQKLNNYYTTGKQ